MNQALILFTRVPLAGKTKTRLQQALTPDQCARAQKAFLRDLTGNCRGPWDMLVFYGGEGPVSVLQQLLPEQKVFYPQEGSGLGEKMDRAIQKTLALGYDRCVLVGSDLPELRRDRIGAAFDALDRADIVLGPTPDGGYYLIGCKAPCPKLFAGQRYGGSTVLENTQKAARAAGLGTEKIPGLSDVDEPRDLEALARRLETASSADCPNTRAFLREIGWMKGTP